MAIKRLSSDERGDGILVNLGKVGIGTTSPSYTLEVSLATAAASTTSARLVDSAAATGESVNYLRVEKGAGYGGALGGYLSQGVGSGLIFSTLNSATLTERMRIDSSGNVGIGTSSPRNLLELSGSTVATSSSTKLQIGGIVGTYTPANYTAVGQEVNRHSIVFSSWRDAVPNTLGAKIEAINYTYYNAVNSYHTSQNTDLVFSTLSGFASGLDSTTERMRITSAGNVNAGIAVTNAQDYAKFIVTDTISDVNNYYNNSRIIISQKTSTVNNMASLSFQSAGASDAAGIWAIIASHTNNATTGSLIFGTSNASGASSERMRITAAGKVLVAAADYGPNMYIMGGLADSPTSYGFVVNTPKPALTAGSYSNMAYFSNNRSSMNDGLRIVNYRFSTGANVGDWQTEDFRIMRDVDQNGFTGSSQCGIVWGSSTLSLMTANTSRLYITSGGLVGIGTTSPNASYLLTVAGSIISSNTNGNIASISTAGHSYIVNGTVTGYNSYTSWRYNGADRWVMHCDSGATLLLTDGDGNDGVYINQNATAWAANSDSRLKDVKETIANAVDKVNQLNGVRFSWKRDADKPDAKTRVGLIAQDVLAVLPEAVDDDTPELVTDEVTGKVSGGLGVRYTELVPLLVNAIKELTTRIATLEQRA